MLMWMWIKEKKGVAADRSCKRARCTTRICSNKRLRSRKKKDIHTLCDDEDYDDDHKGMYASLMRMRQKNSR